MRRIGGTILSEMTPLKLCRLTGASVPSRRDDIRMWGRTRFPCFFSIFRSSWRAATGFLLLVAIVLGVQTEPVCAQTDSEEATYTVTFKGNWNLDSTPGGVVGGAHFTTLIGAVHNSNVTFWRVGDVATAGVERVAELGLTGTFESEVEEVDTDVKAPVKESGTSATGTRTFEVTFSRTHPLLTLLSMIGPSPDWFVGVSGLSLLDESGAWQSSHTANLFPYDAGTEDGENFSLSNAPTSPRGTITSIRGRGRFSDAPMARLSFALKTPLMEEDRCAVSGVTDDQSLKKFVECAAENITASDTFEDTLSLLEEFRDDGGNWNDGSMYLVLLTKRGGVYFHANDRELEGSDWSSFVFCEGAVSVLDRQEGCFIEYEGKRRGYAHPFSVSQLPMARGEEEFVLLGGFDKTPEGKPSTGETGDGGGGCAVGESGDGSAFGPFLAALALLLAVSPKRHSTEDKMH